MFSFLHSPPHPIPLSLRFISLNGCVSSLLNVNLLNVSLVLLCSILLWNSLRLPYNFTYYRPFVADIYMFSVLSSFSWCPIFSDFHPTACCWCGSASLLLPHPLPRFPVDTYAQLLWSSFCDCPPDTDVAVVGFLWPPLLLRSPSSPVNAFISSPCCGFLLASYGRLPSPPPADEQVR